MATFYLFNGGGGGVTGRAVVLGKFQCWGVLLIGVGRFRILLIGVGRFRILGVGGGGGAGVQGLEYWRGQGGQIPSRTRRHFDVMCPLGFNTSVPNTCNYISHLKF